MAKLSPTPYTGNLNLHDYSDENVKKIKAMMDALAENSEKIDCSDPDSDLKGALLRFPVADSYAEYIVVSNRPLTLAHIPAFDAWQIPAAHMRGLSRADILHQLKAAKILHILFKNKGG